MKNAKKLLILGAGQYGMVAKEIAESMNVFSGIAFLDDNNPVAVGKLNEYEKFVHDYDSAVVAVGNSVLRLEMLDKLEQVGFEIPVLIHKSAYVSPSAKIGAGSFVEPMAVVHTEVVIGRGNIISAGTILNHNSKIGAGCHLDCGSIVRARVDISANTKIACGQIIG